MRLRDDPRIRAIRWQDLRPLSGRQVATELTAPLPWLVGALALFHLGWVGCGAICCFFFFLVALRLAHGAQHYALGIGRVWQDRLLFLLSIGMITSLHALQVTHMHHHRACLAPTDVESATARMPWWRAILSGPWFILLLNGCGYRMAGPSKRRWIRAEWFCALAGVTIVFLVGSTGLRWFVAAMIAGECLTGFFAVWTVHHDCDAETEVARTQRGRWKNFISSAMFFHVEHHLFPAVPTPRLHELATRLDQAVPELRDRQVF